MDPESSVELIQRAKTGDAPSLEPLLTRYRARLHRWCTGRPPRYARSFTDTEDVVQEALAGLIRLPRRMAGPGLSQAFSERQFEDILGLDGQHECPIYVVGVGIPPDGDVRHAGHTAPG